MLGQKVAQNAGGVAGANLPRRQQEVHAFGEIKQFGGQIVIEVTKTFCTVFLYLILFKFFVEVTSAVTIMLYNTHYATDY